MEGGRTIKGKAKRMHAALCLWGEEVDERIRGEKVLKEATSKGVKLDQ